MDRKGKCIVLLAAALALSVVLNVVLIWQRQTSESGCERLERYVENTLKECMGAVHSGLEQMLTDAAGALDGGDAYIEENFGSVDQFLQSVSSSLYELSAGMVEQSELTDALDDDGGYYSAVPTVPIKTIARHFEKYGQTGDTQYAEIEDALAEYLVFLEITGTVYTPAAESLSPETSVGILLDLEDHLSSYVRIQETFEALDERFW